MRATVIAKYRAWIVRQPELIGGITRAARQSRKASRSCCSSRCPGVPERSSSEAFLRPVHRWCCCGCPPLKVAPALASFAAAGVREGGEDVIAEAGLVTQLKVPKGG
jgi:hypothetical protein